MMPDHYGICTNNLIPIQSNFTEMEHLLQPDNY